MKFVARVLLVGGFLAVCGVYLGFDTLDTQHLIVQAGLGSGALALGTVLWYQSGGK